MRRLFRFSKSRNILVPWSVGVFLLIAAALKVHGLIFVEPINAATQLPQWVGWILVPGEVALGLWLLSGLQRRTTSIVALIAFSSFASFSLFAALRGERSCGCFGQITVSPWFTFLVDLMAIAAICWWRYAMHMRTNERNDSILIRHTSSNLFSSSNALQHRAILTIMIPCLAIMFPLSWFATGGSSSQGELFVFEPAQWLGKEVPFLKHVDLGDELLQGKWIILLYHHDCPQCQEAVRYYENVKQVSTAPNQLRVALIEVPPYASDESQGKTCRHGKLDQSHEWFMQTPVHLFTSSGRIQRVSHEVFETSIGN